MSAIPIRAVDVLSALTGWKRCIGRMELLMVGLGYGDAHIGTSWYRGQPGRVRVLGHRRAVHQSEWRAVGLKKNQRRGIGTGGTTGRRARRDVLRHRRRVRRRPQRTDAREGAR